MVDPRHRQRRSQSTQPTKRAAANHVAMMTNRPDTGGKSRYAQKAMSSRVKSTGTKVGLKDLIVRTTLRSSNNEKLLLEAKIRENEDRASERRLTS